MTDQDAVQNAEAAHIGGKPHPARNLGIAAGLIGAVGLIALFYWRSGKSDDQAVLELQQFRLAMATQCNQEQFKKPPQKELNSLFADSSRMQTVVHEQLGSLQRGQGNCDQILKSLKSVDFPVE